MGGYGRFTVGRTCCGGDNTGCTLCYDNFNRPNSNSISSAGCGCTACACGWTETVGNWAILNNQLTVPTTSAIALSNVTAQYIRVTLRVNGNGTAYRIIFGYTNASNYNYVQFNGSTLTIVKRVSGTETTLDSESVTNSGVTEIMMCTSPVGQFASIGSKFVSTPVPPPLGRVGLGTGSSVSGTPAFDEVRISSAVSPCPACAITYPYVENCNACANNVVPGAAPAQIQLDIAGVTNGTFCSDCATTLNRTYVCDIGLPHGVADCTWGSPIQTNCGGTPVSWFFNVKITQSGADTMYEVFTFGGGLNTPIFRTTTVGTHPADCIGLSGLVLPVVPGSYLDPSNNCFFGGATATISAILPA